MRKVLAIAASTAISLGAWSIASANGTVKSKEECPPVKHHRHHHKPVHHHPHARHHMAPERHCEPVACAPCPLICSGFFGGIKGGYGWMRGKVRHHHRRTMTGTMVPTGNNRSDIGADGGQIGLFLGYDRIFPNKWLLGLEAGAQWTDISGKSRTSFTVPRTGTFPGVSVFSRTRFKSDWSYDLAVRLGRKVYECSLWYVKLGAQWTHFKLRSHDHVRNLTTGASSSGRHNKRHKYRTGFLAGAGVEVPVACHWSLGAEYNFTWYQRVSSHRRDGNGTNDFGRARIRPYQNQILARVIFRQ